MSVAELYWVDAKSAGRLAVAPRPRGGDWLEDEIRSWKSSGVDVVVCLMEEWELAELDLADEPKICLAEGLAFIHFPLRDRGVPESTVAMREITVAVSSHLEANRNVLVHCRVGIGRTGLVAACCMTVGGIAADDAIARISKARGMPVPDTDAQRRWVEDFAASLS